jgi:hypothetical protein
VDRKGFMFQILEGLSYVTVVYVMCYNLHGCCNIPCFPFGGSGEA